MSERTLRVVVAGASGTVGSALIELLQERRFPLAHLYPFASERSLGRDVEIGDEVLAVETSPPARLQGFDLLFVCTPRGPALDLIREALRAEIPCIDCSGALLGSDEVPLAIAELSPASESLGAPLVISPPGPALAWCRALAALDAVARVERVVGTVLQSASRGGARGLDSLSAETVALLRQEEAPEPEVFSTGIAFDCVPRLAASAGDDDGNGDGDDFSHEDELAATLKRVLGRELSVVSTWVQVPAFVGEGNSLCVEFAAPIDLDKVRAALGEAAGLAMWEGANGPSTRDAAGGDEVLVGGVRRDRSRAHGLQLWLAADPVRLTALNAVKLAEARLRLH